MGTIFTKYFVYPLFWVSKGLNVGQLLPEFFVREGFSAQELADFQWQHLKSLLNHAYKNVPYYRDKMDAIGCQPEDINTFDDFVRLPYLTKDDIINHAEELRAKNFSVSTLSMDSTGGSTGKNICFFEDRNELSHRYAATVRSDSWAGLKLGYRYAQIWGSSLDLGKAVFFRRYLDKFLLQRLFISSFNLSDKALYKAVSQISSYKPKVLIGYPTPLYRLAQYLSSHKIRGLGISAIITSAETLFDYQRSLIEQQFECKLFNRYGCREFGPIAVECEAHQGLHILSDRFVVEFLNISGSESANDIKEMVITDLHKYGMPFIRYRIGDIGTPKEEKCTCGRAFPLLKQVDGRTFDLIIGMNGNIVGGTFWTLLFRSIDGICEFQVIQRRRDSLDINLVVEDGFNKTCLEIVEKNIQEKCGNEMKVHFSQVPQIEASSSGKHRFIISEVAQEKFNI